ncbi:hypothetical protein [Serratia symbiotica]|uniref:hypothetical protein n=1 Tax=Serratia symbiotica TaxID=138074 RepID=UPI00132BAC5B|nr:hypothetical protein [Serratia symbiotica]QTP13341.1 hypothetical protein GPZ83_0000450 [Serratia symbiotica]
MSFNPEALHQKPAAKKNERVNPERLIISVDEYLTPNDGFHYAVGHSIKNPAERVKVRLTTVDERIKDLPRVDADKITKQYRTGDNTRESIADKQKNGIKLIAFDDSIKISAENGVTEYRAHWPTTMSTDPNSEVIFGTAHIRLRESENGSGQAYVEMVKGISVGTAENIDSVLQSALAIKDDQSRARDPFAAIRIIYKDNIVSTTRLYPATEKHAVFDNDMGRNKEINIPVDSDKTIGKLLSGESTGNDFSNKQADTIRAVVAALKGLDLPNFNTDYAANAANIYHGVKGGHLKIEVISFEKLDFGPDSRKTYLKDKEFRPQLKAYDIVSSAEGGKENYHVAGYDQTVVAFQRHPDGEPYVVYASSEAMWPKPAALKDITLEAMAEHIVEVSAEQSFDSSVIDDELNNDEPAL